MKRSPTGQTSLFDVEAPAAAAVEPAPVRSGPRPWDPIDAADLEIGWAYRWVTPARAREIRETTG